MIYTISILIVGWFAFGLIFTIIGRIIVDFKLTIYEYLQGALLGLINIAFIPLIIMETKWYIRIKNKVNQFLSIEI